MTNWEHDEKGHFSKVQRFEPDRRKTDKRSALTNEQLNWATAQMENLDRTLQAVAHDLNVHSRTLQRRLLTQAERGPLEHAPNTMVFRCPKCQGVTNEPICPRDQTLINPSVAYARKLVTEDLTIYGRDGELK